MSVHDYRFRIQRREKIVGLNPKNRAPFLLSENWKVIAGFHSVGDAYWLLDKARKDRPTEDFRLVETAYAGTRGARESVISDWRSVSGKSVVGETKRVAGAVNHGRRK